MAPSRRNCWLSIQIFLMKVFLFLGFQTVIEANSSCTFNKTVGESVQLPLKSPLDPDILKIEWIWNYKNGQKHLVFGKPNEPNPQWYELEDKYKHRFSLTKEFFLSIKDLSTEMSTVYTAQIIFKSGDSRNEVFRLCVYEPLSHPQILVRSSTSTSGWCNVSLECWLPETTENLTVTWLNKGFTGELGQKGTLAAAPNSRRLNLSLSGSQLNGHLTCVVSSPAEQKNVTLHLSSCPQMAQGSHWSVWIGLVAVVLLVILAIGIWIWRRKKTGKAMPGLAAAPKAIFRKDIADKQDARLASPEIPYAEIKLAHSKEDPDGSSGCGHRPKDTQEAHVTYSELQKFQP